AVMVRVRVSMSWVTSVTGMSVLLEQCVDAGDAAPPDPLELGEHRGDRPDRLDVAAGQLLAAATALGEQAGALQHGDMLLDRGEAHVVVRRQGGDGVLPG